MCLPQILTISRSTSPHLLTSSSPDTRDAPCSYFNFSQTRSLLQRNASGQWLSPALLPKSPLVDHSSPPACLQTEISPEIPLVNPETATSGGRGSWPKGLVLLLQRDSRDSHSQWTSGLCLVSLLLSLLRFLFPFKNGSRSCHFHVHHVAPPGVSRSSLMAKAGSLPRATGSSSPLEVISTRLRTA